MGYTLHGWQARSIFTAYPMIWNMKFWRKKKRDMGFEIVMYIFLQDRELQNNGSDQSLFLQGITRDAAGNYSCRATNTEGSNRSNIIYLHVMCKLSISRYHYIDLFFTAHEILNCVKRCGISQMEILIIYNASSNLHRP